MTLRVFKKTLALTVVVQAESEPDAQYWVKQALTREIGGYEDFDVTEVGSEEDLPDGYSLADMPDNGDESTIGDLIQPRGLDAMRRAREES